VLPLVEDLAREAPMELPPGEGQHVFGAQTERGVPQEPRVELAQGGATCEQDVGRLLRNRAANRI